MIGLPYALRFTVRPELVEGRIQMEHPTDNFIEQLQSILSLRERTVIEQPSFCRAAVLIPLFKKGKDYHLLFTKRTEQVKHHKGEISFPGGAFDEGDFQLEKTALREAFEEIGLREEDVQVLGALDDIITRTEFIVTPFVGIFSGYPYPFKLSPVEIEELIEVPLPRLLDQGCFGERVIIQGDSERAVESYQYGKYIIWGATARILRQFLELIPRQVRNSEQGIPES